MTNHLPLQALTARLGDHPQGRVTIDLDALAANFRRLRGLASPAETAAVVKADGYGLGALEVARRLLAEGCRQFFVARADEGVMLRQAGLNGMDRVRIYVLDGIGGAPPSLFAAFDLVPVLFTLEDLAHWSDAAALVGHRLPVGLQLETGMHRLGLTEAEIIAIAANPERLDGLDLVLVMSHLACADEAEHPQNHAQLRRFKDLAGRLPDAPLSLANSAGILLGPAFHFDLVRPGIALYGGNPRLEADTDLRPVVTLEARILQIHEVPAGGSVGYGASYTADTPRRIATLGVGYDDGYPRSLSNRGWASLAGYRVPVIGRVSMDLITLDISAIPPTAVAVGDWAELFGPHIPLDEVARSAGTIGYELLTQLGPRYARAYKGATGAAGSDTGARTKRMQSGDRT